MTEARLSAQLLGLLGHDDFIRLAEAFGGTRLYVSAEGAEIARRVSVKAAATLAARYQGDTIRVPLARDIRARHYRAQDMTNVQIARKLGITETAVDKIFHRMPGKPAKGTGLQPDLFAKQH